MELKTNSSIDNSNKEITNKSTTQTNYYELTQSDVQIPIYIQKKIYKYLLLYEKGVHESYDAHSHVIRKFASLSWEWFEFLSTKVDQCLIIKNYDRFRTLSIEDNSNKFLLRKPDSIKYLKLVSLSNINLGKINQTLSCLKNLKWITSEHNNPERFSQIQFDRFRINSLFLYEYSEINDINDYIKRIDYIYIPSNLPSQKIIHAFSNCKIYGFSSNLKQNTFQYAITKFPWKQLYQTKVTVKNTKKVLKDEPDTIEIYQNRLVWLKNLNFSVINVKTLYQFLKSSPTLNHLSFSICFHNLIYKLNKRYNSNFDGYDPQFKPCECSSTFERCTPIESDEESDETNKYYNEDDLFSFYWDQIISIFSNHKYLKNLEIKNRCFRTVRFDDDVDRINLNQENHKSTIEQRQYFYQSINNIFCNNTSIKTLNIDVNFFKHLELIHTILNNNNNNIDHYNFSYQNDGEGTSNFIKTIQKQYLLSKNCFKNDNVLSFNIFLTGTTVFSFEKK